MQVLVVHGSKMGGTAGLAEMIGAALRSRGHRVEVSPAAARPDPGGFDAVVIGGALYSSHWHRQARRFVKRNVLTLRPKLTWFFSSGPLDDRAAREELPPVAGVTRLMHLVEAQGHHTFGGVLGPDPGWFPASAMARRGTGDWRDPGDIARWADSIDVVLRSRHRSPAHG